jgi:hypothetical protein
VLLFWGLFLPMGAYFSVDAVLNSGSPPKSMQILSMPTAALIIQVCIIYWSATVFKWNPDWLEGNAVSYALEIDQFATDAGVWLRSQTALLPGINYLTLFIEACGPFFAFIPIYTGPIRTLTVFCFISLHFGFATFLSLGLFPFISSTAWLFFLPGWFWDTLLPRLGLSSRMPTFSFIKRLIFTRLSKRPLRIEANLFENIVSGVLITYVALISAALVKPQLSLTPLLGPKWNNFGNLLHINESWNMFSHPLRDDGWYVVEGVLLNGKSVDLFQNGAPLTWKKPTLVSATYQNDRWRKYLMNLWWKINYKHRKFFSEYQCREWNKVHTGIDQIDHLNFYFVLERTQSDASKSRPERVLIWRQKCIEDEDNEINRLIIPSQ